MPDSVEYKQKYAQILQLEEILRKLNALSNQLTAIGVKHQFQVDQTLLKKDK